MADEKKLEQARLVYATVCQALDAREWTYDKFEDDLTVTFGVSGDDLPMRLVISVDVDRQLVRILSPLTFNMSEEKRVEGAIAACAASYGMADGSFDYDLSDGTVVFRINAAFHKSHIGVELIQYMIECSMAMVDHYNDRFLALDKGMITIAEFINNEN